MSEHIWKFQIGHWFELSFWPKSCLFFFTFEWNKSGYEKIVPVSESFWSNLKFLRMIDLTAWLWGWNVRVNGMRSVFSFSAVCSADCRLICWAQWWPAWTTETGYPSLSKKLAHCFWFSEKSESSLHKRRCLRNCEKGMVFLMCDGCEDGSNRSDEGLPLETSAFLLFTVANLRFQLLC